MYALFRRIAKHVQSLDIQDLDLDEDLTLEIPSVANVNVASARQARAFLVAWKFACDDDTLRKRIRWNELCAKVTGVSFDGAKNVESAERFCRAVLEKEGFVGEFPQNMYLLSNHLVLTEFKGAVTTPPGESAKFRDKEPFDAARDERELVLFKVNSTKMEGKLRVKQGMKRRMKEVSNSPRLIGALRSTAVLYRPTRAPSCVRPGEFFDLFGSIASSHVNSRKDNETQQRMV